MTTPESPRKLWTVIAASSAGTLIEWYDFYIFATLSAIVSSQFFPAEEGIVGFIKTLAIVWIGFVVRPFGALVFGRMGDIVGRKYAFLVTLVMMGGATFAIGLLPTYEQVGLLSPMLLLGLRVMQGLALGGEYGGAATYVAEHCPDGKRGFYTSWIQTTATLGLFASLGVILFCRTVLFDKAEFERWGWRVPFWLSLVLVIFSFVLRMRLQESPLFQKIKASGKASVNPLRESFTKWPNLKLVLIALFGAAAGQGVVWYTGQFYALAFMQKTLMIEFKQSNYIIAPALLLATPFFIFWGAMSDRWGRKWIMLAGCLIALLTYLPIYHRMDAIASPANKQLVTNGVEQVGAPVTVRMERADKVSGAAVGDTVTSSVFDKLYTDGSKARFTRFDVRAGDPSQEVRVREVLTEMSLGERPYVFMILLIAIQVFYVTMVYGPIAAFLVELFPTRIRYTSMSLPYHIGNGVFGGLVPFAAMWIAAAYAGQTGGLADLVGGARFLGLLYPMSIAAITVVVGAALVRERFRTPLDDTATRGDGAG
jgi:MFS family permease